jgi:hypothetical protein
MTASQAASPRTRSFLKKIQFDHVLKEILKSAPEDILYKVLTNGGVEDMPSLLSSGEDFLRSLTWNDGTDDHTISGFQMQQIKILRAWDQHLQVDLGKRNIDWSDLLLISEDEWDEYRVADYQDPALAARVPSNLPPRGTTSSTRSVASAATEFRKGIKRDKSHYTVLKDEKQWDEWKRATISTVYAHGCENILSRVYVPDPTDADETNLFSEQNKFMYDVFLMILKTPMGKHFIRLYENSRNAQAVWKDLIGYMKTSTRADLEIEGLMTSLTSYRFTSNYKGNVQSFILEWLDRMRQYEDFTHTSAHFPEVMKKAMLQNALMTLKIFKDLKISEQFDCAKGKGPVAYHEYVKLVQQVAGGYDAAQQVERRPPPRQAHMSEYHQYDDDYHGGYEASHEGNDFDEDGQYFGSMSVFQANRERQPPGNFRKRPSLPKAVWSILSREDQLAWDQISDNSKFKIIFAYKDHLMKQEQTERPAPSRDKRFVKIHEVSEDDEAEEFQDAHEEPEPPADRTSHDLMINEAASRSSYDPGDVCSMMSTKKKGVKKPNLRIETKMHEITGDCSTYVVSNHHANTRDDDSLVDRGANGGLAGSNMRVIAATDRRVNISGIDNHEMTGLRIVSAGGVVPTQRGDIIGVFHQYAHVPQGRTIHSAIQLESFGMEVDDRSKVLNRGSQTLTTPEGYVLPLDFRNGLPYLPLRPYTDHEWRTLPHVCFTSDVDWEPDSADCKLSDKDEWYDAISNEPPEPRFFDTFNEYGEHRAAITVDTHDFRTEFFGSYMPSDADPGADTYGIHNTRITEMPKDYENYRDYFMRASVNVIKKTFEATTQFARSGWITGRIYDTYRAPFPALNVIRRNEGVATDTFYFPEPAVDDGSVCGQFYVGTTSKFVETHGMKTDSHFIRTLWDTIRRYGAMDVLISDRAQVEISKKVQEVLRYLCIRDRQSEPLFQHQNPAERRYQVAKHNCERVMNTSGAPASCMLLCMQYVCFIMNRMALASLDWRTPCEVLHGHTPDISMIYRFKFYDRVYIKRGRDSRGESVGVDGDDTASDEIGGRFVGFSESVGHPMTYRVLTDKTQKLIFRSRVKLASVDPNRRIDHPKEDDECRPTVEAEDVKDDEDDEVDGELNMVDDSEDAIDDVDDREEEHRPGGMIIIDPNDIIGRTYLSNPAEDGTRMRLRITQRIEEDEDDRRAHPTVLEFLSRNGEDTYEEVVSYNQILDHLEDDDDGEDGLWRFKSISAHEGPLVPSNPRYKGSKYNVRVHWENGEISYEPLSIIGSSDPVSVAIYGRDNGLLDVDGWKRYKKLALRQKRLVRMARQAKLQSFRNREVFKFGIQVPQNHKQAMAIDEANGNSVWRDAEGIELRQIDEYQTFTDLGYKADAPKGHKKIRVHMVYDVKHDLRRKARLVADGNLTEVPLASVYSSVVSLKGLRMTIFLAELNDLDLWCTDIGNAYLEATTDEKVYILAGNEFAEREGHTLIIHRALYGLRTSGARWHERFSDVLREMGFVPSRAEDDIWMRDCGDHYEYIARYVDDLAIASKDPGAITKELMEKFKFKLKGTGPITYHLGCDFFRDSTGTLCMQPKKYIERMEGTYLQMFGSKPKTTYSSPIEKGDHPELDTSEELNEKGIQQYQSLIGAAQWLVTLGRFDIATAVMTMSSFRVAPRKGHLERMRRLYGYVTKMRHGCIRFRTELPDYSGIPVPDNQWAKSIYGDCKEQVPEDAPRPLGKPVIMTTYVDANLCHDMTTGKSVTGVLHFLNKTPIDAFTKKQATVETATYGSEFVAGRTATEQIMDNRISLRYLGVPIMGATYMFGDNKSVVDSSMRIASRLNKRHVLLSYHRVREAIASGVLYFIHIRGAINPADILSKSWGYSQVWPMLKPILFWEGDTYEINRDQLQDRGE